MSTPTISPEKKGTPSSSAGTPAAQDPPKLLEAHIVSPTTITADKADCGINGKLDSKGKVDEGGGFGVFRCIISEEEAQAIRAENKELKTTLDQLQTRLDAKNEIDIAGIMIGHAAGLADEIAALREEVEKKAAAEYAATVQRLKNDKVELEQKLKDAEGEVVASEGKLRSDEVKFLLETKAQLNSELAETCTALEAMKLENSRAAAEAKNKEDQLTNQVNALSAYAGFLYGKIQKFEAEEQGNKKRQASNAVEMHEMGTFFVLARDYQQLITEHASLKRHLERVQSELAVLRSVTGRSEDNSGTANIYYSDFNYLVDIDLDNDEMPPMAVSSSASEETSALAAPAASTVGAHAAAAASADESSTRN